jgi:hypothetical protein
VAGLAALPRETLLTALVGFAAVGLALVMARGFKRYQERAKVEVVRAERRATLQRVQQEQETAVPPEELEPLQLTLLWLDDALQVKQRFPLEADHITLGRAATEGQIGLADRSVSPLHARIRWRNGQYWLYDEGSTSGTFLNHERLGLGPRPLTDGDLIQLGRVALRVELRPSAPKPENNNDIPLRE